MSTDDAKAEDAAATGAEANAAAAKAARPRHRRFRDMALSLAVLLVPIGLFYLAWSWLAEDRQVSVVDTAENYSAAEGLGLDVVEPELGGDWRPISSDLAVEGETVVLRTGWYSPDGNGLQLVQTNGDPSEAAEAVTGSGTPVEVAGIEWAAYDLNGGEAWVAELDGSTVVLTAEPDGVADLDALAAGVAEAIK